MIRNCLIATGLMTVLAMADPAGAQVAASQANAGGEAEPAQQTHVAAESEREASGVREKIVEEAVAALSETEQALRSLDAGDTEAALASIERAVGKLQVVLARSPDMALAPVRVETITRDVLADKEVIREQIEEAEELLDDERIQEARRLLRTLGSEIVVRTTFLPMATFPGEIALVAPLIDRGEIEMAKQRLTTTLSTAVVGEVIIPLPLVRAEVLLEEAETLAETADRTEEQNARLNELLQSAQEQLEMAELLGYGRESDFEPMYEELDSIRSKTRGERSGEGFFDTIREQLDALRRTVFRTDDAPEDGDTSHSG